MAWRDGFFDSVNDDRTYNAQDMSEMFMGLLSDGVYASVGNKLAVQPNNGMTIQVNTGRGYFGGHWVKNDSEYLHTLEGSDVLLNRYCAVCIRVDETTSGRNAQLHFKYSDFATSPTKPAMQRGEDINEYCLAYVFIRAGAYEITAADIEDTRGDNSLCGWVSGLIEQLDTTTLWEQYKAEWENFLNTKEGDFEEWYSGLKTTLEGDVAAALSSKVQELESDVAALNEAVEALGEALVTQREEMTVEVNRFIRQQFAHMLNETNMTLRADSWTKSSDGKMIQRVENEAISRFAWVFPVPAENNRDAYIEAGCRAFSQDTGALVFLCESVPTVDISVTALVVRLN